MKNLKTLLFTSLLVLASCTGSKDDNSSTATATDKGTVTKKGGKNILTINLNSEPSSLHPIMSSDYVATQVQNLVLEPLVNLDEDTLEYHPGLAEKYTISEDGKTFTFTLRENLKWHDGTPLTTADILFTFDTYFDDRFKALSSRPYLTNIDKPIAIDERTIQFKVNNPFHGNFGYLTGICQPIPKHIYSDPKEKGIGLKLVGSGPYMLKEFRRGKRIILERNPNWWGNSVPRNAKWYEGIDEVHFKFIQEPAVQMEAFKKGKIDYIFNIRSNNFVKLATGKGWGTKFHKVKTQNKGPKRYSFAYFNLKKKLFQDVRVRKALNFAMNRPMIIKKFHHDLELPGTGPWASQSIYANPKVKALDFDLAQASALLKEAGWQDEDKNGILEKTIDGKKTEFRFTIQTANKEAMRYLTVYKEDLTKVGIHVDLNVTEWTSYVKLIDDRDFDMMLLGWGGGAIDLDPKQLWHCNNAKEGGSNYSSYCNKEVDRLIDVARETLKREERIPVLQKIYKMIAEDYPVISLWSPKYELYTHQDRVKKEKDTLTYGLGSQLWKVIPE